MLIIPLFSIAQKQMDFISGGIRMNKLDFYLETGVGFQGEKTRQYTGLGFGINKSIFQQRLNPLFFYELTSNFNQFKILDYQGVVSFHSSFFNSNRQQREFHFFHELLIGFQLGLGKKNKLYFQPELGFLSESFHSDKEGKWKHVVMGNYSAKIAYRYVF